jgi:hypothetical protein
MSGYYPAGAEYDPNAPWNQADPTMVECAACAGKGYHWFAYDINADEDVECTEETWNIIPETEEEAIAKGQHFIRSYKEICEVCDGIGEVECELDYEDYD